MSVHKILNNNFMTKLRESLKLDFKIGIESRFKFE